MLEFSLEQIIIIFIVTSLGSALQGSVGYGMGLIASPILLMLESDFIPGAMTITATLLVILMVLRERSELDFWGLRWAIFGSLPGTIIGTFLLTRLDSQVFAVVFGVFILGAVGMSISRLKIEPHRPILFSAGFLSGLMGMLTTMSGPAIGLVYQNSPGPRLRATMSGYFIMNIVLAFGSLIPAGKMGIRELGLSLYLIPGMLVGFFLSSFVKPYLDKGYTRAAVLVVATASGVFILVQQLF